MVRGTKNSQKDTKPREVIDIPPSRRPTYRRKTPADYEENSSLIHSGSNYDLTDDDDSIPHTSDFEELSDSGTQSDNSPCRSPPKTKRPSPHVKHPRLVPEAASPSKSHVRLHPEDKQSKSCCMLMSCCFVLIIASFIFAYPQLREKETYVEFLKSVDCKVIPLNKCSKEAELAVQIAIKETQRFDRPSVLLFTYREDQKQTKDEILEQVLKYAACYLNGGRQFVEITEEIYSAPEVVNDRGKLITRFKQKLEEHAVMMVHNLEKVPGNVAMAFHFICDQYTPLVKRALIIFTVKYDGEMRESNETSAAMIERILTDKWKNQLKEDDIPPLLARLTNEILEI